MKSIPTSRPPFERMLKIHQAIQSGVFPNARGLAGEMEVSAKSVQRDIEFMRSRMNLPVKFNAAKNGYYYDGDVGAFPTLQITEGELIALLVAEKALQQYRGTTFERPLLSAFQKMTASLPETISVHLADWNETIAFKRSTEQIIDLGIFDQLAKAAARREQLELEYRKPGKSGTEPRIVDPYQLANVNGEWYLFAYCHLRKDIRTFVPARIKGLKKTGQKFERPERFSLEKRLHGSFGVHSAKGDFEVVIDFSDLVADYIREKRWHPSQELTELGKGAVRLRFQLSSLEEVERWILGWGGEAIVRKPAALKNSIREAGKTLAKAHS